MVYIKNVFGITLNHLLKDMTICYSGSCFLKELNGGRLKNLKRWTIKVIIIQKKLNHTHE